jgi:hypothetical protein
MGKSERNRTRAARERIAAQHAAARRAERRRRGVIAGGSVVVVLAVLVVLIVVSRTRAPVKAGPPVTSGALAAQVTGVPTAAFNAVGPGTAAALRAISKPPAELILHGKPEILYMGGEYCPYCAAERWAITAAVSRFGRLAGLQFIHSAPDDGDIATLSFYRSRFTSKYVAFVPVEVYGEARDPATPFGHVYLQRPTAAEASWFAQYAGGGIPFLDIANRYLLAGVSYQPSELAGLSWAQIAAAMHDPSSTLAVDIDGAANVLTAGICAATHGQPASVCGSSGVTRASRSR